MSLPPERISIKRRRQDEPVDTLILENDPKHDQKRRFTDFVFQRLRHDEAVNPQGRAPQVPSIQATRNYQHLGIPAVRISVPGDEIKDLERYKLVHRAASETTENSAEQSLHVRDSSLLSSESSSRLPPSRPVPTRRFHLTRDISSSLRPNPTNGIRRPKINLRPPLATFVERYSAKTKANDTIYNHPPVDSIIELDDKALESDVSQLVTKENAVGKRMQVSTFQKPPSSSGKQGTSIRDDPSTWDHDSDQLANELAALAFDIDPSDAAEPPHFISSPTTSSETAVEQPPEPMLVDRDDDFVFETYIRIKNDSTKEFSTVSDNVEVGLLVIDDENEDLWEKYIHSDDDDDEWDEEDEDSNAEDNPRNEYPDEEVSTDDELGRNVYKYRRNASDDEDYDDW